MPDVTIITDNISIEDTGSEDKEGFWSMISPKPGDNDQDLYGNQTLPPGAIAIFVVLLALSGIFSSTFTLVFAYISDTVRHQDDQHMDLPWQPLGYPLPLDPWLVDIFGRGSFGSRHGVKALTEGIGPLVFGSLMTLSEHSMLPGWLYLLAAFRVYFAYKAADDLPDREDDDYIHELDRKHNKDTGGGILLQCFIKPKPKKPISSLYIQKRDDGEDQGLLSDINESEFDTPFWQEEDRDGEDVSRLPITFASLVNMPPP